MNLLGDSLHVAALRRWCRFGAVPLSLLALAGCGPRGVAPLPAAGRAIVNTPAAVVPIHSAAWPGLSPPPYHETVLVRFQGPPKDGIEPQGPLLPVAGGAFFGTTQYGGAFAAGALFELTPAGTGYSERIVYDFGSFAEDGAQPRGSLVTDKSGDLFGTLEVRGIFGQGIVYELKFYGSFYLEHILHDFRYDQASQGGSDPVSGLVADTEGAMYGTTSAGGEYNLGIVYELMPNQTYRILHSFGKGRDGAIPDSLIVDRRGVLYGTTNQGGASNAGTVFKMTPNANGYAESVVYHFAGGGDGATPLGGVIIDKTGALYGTTAFGGSRACPGGGCGQVFKLTPSANGYHKTVLYRFQGGSDGATPATLIRDASQTLYGTTWSGGNAACGIPGGCGTVFKLTPSASGYRETILHRFQGGTDGAEPGARLIADAQGALYGTTARGGGGPCGGSAAGCGTAFKLTPAGTNNLLRAPTW